MDFLNATPDALLSVDDAAKVLHMTCCRMFAPENYCVNYLSQEAREGFLTTTAGGGAGGGWKPSENTEVQQDPEVQPIGWRAEGLGKGFLIGKDLDDERVPP